MPEPNHKMLVVERPCLAGLMLALVLPLAPAAATAQTQDPTVVWLSDAVGNTIDRAERDSFRLFPNTAGFQQAVILALPGPEYCAKVVLSIDGTTKSVFFRVMPTELDRIRFLIDNREQVSEQVASDSSAALAFASFWREIEERPLQGLSGGLVAEPVAAGPPSLAAAMENRCNYTLHGMTCGSVAGGCIGSYTGYTLIEPGHYEQTECGTFYVPALYRVNLAALLATSMGATALGAAAGYALGDAQDRKPASAPLAGEGTTYRNGCAGASVLPAIALGILTGVAARGSLFGRENNVYNLENDPAGWSAVPAVLTGLCVSVEVVTIGYHIGRAIDRRKAEEAAAKRRALGRQESP